jgi:hypothetical protein
VNIPHSDRDWAGAFETVFTKNSHGVHPVTQSDRAGFPKGVHKESSRSPSSRVSSSNTERQDENFRILLADKNLANQSDSKNG